jgi:hypothetical protein
VAQTFHDLLAAVAGKSHKVNFSSDFDRYRSGLLYYWNKAEPLYRASELVWPGFLLSPIAIMLVGMAMELLLKGIYVAFDKKVPRHHRLHDLCAGLGINLSKDDRSILRAISEHVIWTARYTTPKGAVELFDASELFEERRQSNGPKAFLVVTRQDCSRLWELVTAHFHQARQARPESVVSQYDEEDE